MTCQCGSGETYTYWVNDARGIPVAKVCDQWHDDKLKGYRPDIFTDQNYWSNEPIEPLN